MLLMHNYLTRLLRTPLARASYIVLFDLKPLIEDSNLQVYMYCVHTRKRASGAPRTHSRACKISKFPGGVPQDPLTQIHFVGPYLLYLPWALQSSRRPWPGAYLKPACCPNVTRSQPCHAIVRLLPWYLVFTSIIVKYLNALI